MQKFTFLTLRFLSSGNSPLRTPSIASETQALHDTRRQSALCYSVENQPPSGPCIKAFCEAYILNFRNLFYRLLFLG
jgi:hypothetical protein